MAESEIVLNWHVFVYIVGREMRVQGGGIVLNPYAGTKKTTGQERGGAEPPPLLLLLTHTPAHA